jgi:nucleoside-triphosphatase THEP1
MALVKVITGGKNTGKTTMVKKLEAQYLAAGISFAGFVSEAEYLDGRKSSYYLRDIGTGLRILSVTESITPEMTDYADYHQYSFSKFYFNQKSFDFEAVQIEKIIKGSAENSPDVVFIDEIGPLELSGEGHYRAVRKLLNYFDGLVIIVIRDELLPELLDKLDLDIGDTEIIRTADEYQV